MSETDHDLCYVIVGNWHDRCYVIVIMGVKYNENQLLYIVQVTYRRISGAWAGGEGALAEGEGVHLQGRWIEQSSLVG